ncbi:signal-induced proliferation-associated 1-like protein 3 isoform X2 [Triplophysa rosa]|uniref:signal-induced proliferation-associated 1-like protein 3 isoform X2 n=1 Tax=Triplophysa rosa TaxID=992332 RepID=UPI002545FCD3|nr:signal-induced proliferation-associated 1-like protein 3 isoform X2 [Triplophysa rosa]
MSASFWDLNYSMSTSPSRTPPIHFARSDFSFYDQSQCSSPIQDNHNNLDWTSNEQVEFTRLNPSRTRDSTGEWHMVTATRSLLGSERGGQRESLQSQGNLSYNSLPRAHFLQPNRESSAFLPYTKDIWLDAQNITGSPRSSPKLHPRTQPGFYSDATQSTKNALKGSSTSNMKEFNAHTLPLPCSKTGLLKLSKPQKVKTFVVETPPLMRAVIAHTSPNSNQPSKKHVSKQQREDHHAKNEDQSLSKLQEPNIKHFGNDPFVWSRSQPSSPGRYQDLLSTKDHLSINTHLFPERQSATLSQNVQKAIQERFSMSVDSQGDPNQPNPCQPHGSLNLPDCSQKEILTLHQEHSDVRNGVSQVATNSKNVFGQPRIMASLRAACSPRSVRKSTVLEDLKKLIVMDDTEDDPRDDSSPLQQKEVELCASPLSSSHATQSYPESPALTPSHLSMQTRPTECWPMPEQAETDKWERDQDHYSELMPLPNTACHLDWDSLVQAAQAYETQRMATLLSEMSPLSSRPATPSQGTYKSHHSTAYYTGEDADDVFIDFPDQLSHLEAMLKRLSSDLLKEKRDKVALLAQVLKLRISNQHLREESLCAVEQLHKISNILNATPGGVE